MADLCYPMNITDERDLDPDEQGPVFIWDIDKTYLATRFSSTKHLLRIPLEFAVDKKAIPGMPEVLRGIRRGTTDHYASAPLYFVSASPPQLKAVIQRKMLLDAVAYDGITFKDWAATVKQLRPGRLNDHVGFKLCALLEGKARRPYAREFLFGDDVEQDTDAYSLYAKLLDGTVTVDTLVDNLVRLGVAADDASCAARLFELLPPNLGPVDSILIHTVRNTPPASLTSRDPRVTPVKDALQLALVLFAKQVVDARTVSQAADALAQRVTFGQRELNERLADALDRGLVSHDHLQNLKMVPSTKS